MPRQQSKQIQPHTQRLPTISGSSVWLRVKPALRHGLAKPEIDTLRFRAPSHVNDIIRNFADKQVFIDSEARLRGRDPQGFIGNNVMLEHLHPNASGYFVIANAFYDRLVESEVFDDIRTIDVNTAWQRRPIIPAKEYAGFADVQVLMSDYPFTDSPQPVKLPHQVTPISTLVYSNIEKSLIG